MFTGISLGAVVAIIAVIALLGIIASGYVKAPPDTAYIISGLQQKNHYREIEYQASRFWNVLTS